MESWKEDLLNALLAPDEQPELFGRITRIARGWGFEHCAYGMRAPLPVAEPEIVMLNDYAPAWQKHYQAHGYLRIDPLVQRGMTSLETFAWSGIDATAGPATGFWEEARAHGIATGVSIPALAANSVRGMLTLSRSHENMTEREFRGKRSALVWLGQMAHHGLARHLLLQWRSSAKRDLSERETEVLRWVAEGKTNRQIAAKVGVTERTVHFHLNNAMSKLGVGNRTAAAVRAVVLGIIG